MRTVQDFLNFIAQHLGESGKLTIDLVESLCPACAETMRTNNITAIALPALRESEQFQARLTEEFTQSQCDAIGGPDGFFTRCASKMAGNVDDPDGFCAELHNYCLGKYPAQHAKVQEKNLNAFLQLREGDNKTGAEFEVVFISAGFSENKHPSNRLPIEYPEETLSNPEVLKRFENVPIKLWEFSKDGRPLKTHLPDGIREGMPGAFPKQTVGLGIEPRFAEYSDHDGKKRKGIVGKVKFFDERLKSILRGAWEAGKKNLVGLSIDAEAIAEVVKNAAGQLINKVVNIVDLPEVTVVDRPGAGGILLRMTEQNYNMEHAAMDPILALFRTHFPDLVASITDEMAPEEKWAKFQEILMSEAGMAALAKLKVEEVKEAKPPVNGQANGAAVPQVNGAVSNGVNGHANGANGAANLVIPQETIAQFAKVAADTAAKVAAETSARVFEEIRTKESAAQAKETARKNSFTAKVKEAKLPAEEESYLLNIYTEIPLEDQQVNTLIAKTQQKVARLQESGVYAPNQGHEVEFSKDEYDKHVAAMTGMLTNQKVDNVEPFHSVHQSYRIITGANGGQEYIARRLFQDMAHCLSPDPILKTQDQHRTHLREMRMSGRFREDALQLSTWAEVFGDSIRKSMIAFYKEGNWEEAYQLVSEISSAPDFRTMRRVRIGGLADLADVSELGTYQEISIPGDEEETFAVGKKGNLFTYSMEATYNDNLNALRRIPMMIGRSAARGIYKSILDVFRTNPTMGDGTALFHANHGNLGSTALSATTLGAGILAMRDQTELSSSEVLQNDNTPKFVIFPNELETTAWELAKSNVSLTSGRAETVNNWFLNFGLTPLTPVGYWTDANNWYLSADPKLMPTIEISFLNGRREPEVLIQDAPTVGSYYTADAISVKGRIIYGVKALDYRGLYAAVVA